MKPSPDRLAAAFVIKTMSQSGGGAERVLAQVASALAARGHAITMISRDDRGSTDYYPSNGVNRIRLGGWNERSGPVQVLGLARQLRRIIKEVQPHIAIGFMHSSFIPLGLGLLGTGIPVLASEHTVMDHYRTRPAERWILNTATFLVDDITVVSNQAKATFPPWLRRKMTVVPNPLVSVSGPTCRDTTGRKLLLSVGRLDEGKDHATLISAFASLAARHPEWDLEIAGEGDRRTQLQQQIDRLDLASRIRLLGAVRNIGQAYARADLFVTASRYESFGLATAEALLAGIPAIGFADCPGTNEIIHDGHNGLLVRSNGPRHIALASALEFAMTNDTERMRWALKAPESVMKYNEGHVVDIWERVLINAIN